MQKAGIKVLRTWGFNMINATELPYVKANDLTYYQVHPFRYLIGYQTYLYP
jgi:mannan endo-1,4-beta-mannosidase